MNTDVNVQYHCKATKASTAGSSLVVVKFKTDKWEKR